MSVNEYFNRRLKEDKERIENKIREIVKEEFTRVTNELIRMSKLNI